MRRLAVSLTSLDIAADVEAHSETPKRASRAVPAVPEASAHQRLSENAHFCNRPNVMTKRMNSSERKLKRPDTSDNLTSRKGKRHTHHA